MLSDDLISKRSARVFLARPCWILLALKADTGIVNWAVSSMQIPCIYNVV